MMPDTVNKITETVGQYDEDINGMFGYSNVCEQLGYIPETNKILTDSQPKSIEIKEDFNQLKEDLAEPIGEEQTHELHRDPSKEFNKLVLSEDLEMNNLDNIAPILSKSEELDKVDLNPSVPVSIHSIEKDKLTEDAKPLDDVKESFEIETNQVEEQPKELETIKEERNISEEANQGVIMEEGMVEQDIERTMPNKEQSKKKTTRSIRKMDSKEITENIGDLVNNRLKGTGLKVEASQPEIITKKGKQNQNLANNVPRQRSRTPERQKSKEVLSNKRNRDKEEEHIEPVKTKAKKDAENIKKAPPKAINKTKILILGKYHIDRDLERRAGSLGCEIVDDHQLEFDIVLCNKLSKSVKMMLAINRVYNDFN